MTGTRRPRQDARLQTLIDSSPLALVEFGLDTRVGVTGSVRLS